MPNTATYRFEKNKAISVGPSATLTQEYSESPYKARVSVRAGADTTETDLAFVEFYLAHKPDIFRYHDKLSFYAKLKI